MPGVRPGQRRALRDLGRPLRARAPPGQAAGGLSPSPSSAPSQPQPRHARRDGLRASAALAPDRPSSRRGAGAGEPDARAGATHRSTDLQTRGRAGDHAAFVDVVLLACDGAPWLPRALRALEQQTRAPDRLVLADAGSTDDSPRLLTAHASRSRLVGGPPALPVLQLTRGAGLLDAARAALLATDVAALTAPLEVPPPGGGDAGRQHTAVPAALRWVWLLHDDCAPAPDALEQLLAAVEVAPSVGVAGCKVVDWDDEGLLHQVGFSTSAMGRRLTGVEHGDRDQGQRDHRDDVLAVSTAGMLVRRDLLERLGGDPALAVLGEDLDLCRRARLAGSRVVVVPGAVVRHVDATRSGLRDTRASRAVRWTERRHEAHARLVAAAPLWLPLVALAVLAGGLVRALVRVAAKQPDRAGAELSAVLAALARPRRVATARRAAARTAVRPRSALRPLMVPRREVARWHRDRWARTGIAPATGVLPVVAARALAEGTARVLDAVTPSHGLPLLPSPTRSPESAAPTPAADLPTDAAGSAPAPAPAPGRPGALVLVPLLLALAALGVVALHRLLGGGQVVGGALAAAPDLPALWAAARSDWQPAGLGAAAPSDPWLSLLAVLSAPLGGSVHAAVLALLLLALPLAALGGWTAAGAATRSRLLRAAAALAWAGAAPLLAASSTGRLGALAAHLALPWVAVGLARAATAPARRPALAAGALAGLAGAAAVCGAPVLLLPLLALVAVVALTARRWPGALLWTALPLLAAGGPLLAPALADPRVLLLGPGLPLATPAVSSWRLLLADPGGALGDPLGGGLGGAVVLGVPVGALALAPGALLLVLALVGAAARGVSGRVARTAWWAVGLGLLAAVGAVRAGGWAGPGTSLVLAGLGAAALARAPRLLRTPADQDDADQDDADALAPLDDARWDGPDDAPAPRTRRSGPRARWAASAAVVGVLAPLALAGAWALQQSGGGLLERRPASAGDPAVAADAAVSPDAVSTLHLALADDGAATVTVRRGPLVLSSSSVVADLARGGSGAVSARTATTAAAADAAVRSATALLAAGSDDPRAALAELGVAYVLLEPPAGSTTASAAATARLDAVTGLARAGSTDAGVLYRVLPASGSGDDAADRPSRARLVDADGGVITALASRGQVVDAAVPAADPAQALLGGRSVVVAERSDPGWTARLDGRRLPVVTVDGWALGVEVPDAGGHLVITRTGAASSVWDWLQGAVLLLTALLAVPVPVRGRRAP